MPDRSESVSPRSCSPSRASRPPRSARGSTTRRRHDDRQARRPRHLAPGRDLPLLPRLRAAALLRDRPPRRLATDGGEGRQRHQPLSRLPLGARCGAERGTRTPHPVPGDTIVVHDRVALSPTVSMPDGGFRFAYVPWLPDWPAFDREAERLISAVRAGGALDPNPDPLAPVAYLSCMPWVDFTALTNALPDAADCVPRVAWGRIVPKDDGFDMAAGIELHHAVADGRHAGTFFEAAAAALGEF